MVDDKDETTTLFQRRSVNLIFLLRLSSVGVLVSNVDLPKRFPGSEDLLATNAQLSATSIKLPCASL
jgi:hypothetical protein